jgi:toxin CcdB
MAQFDIHRNQNSATAKGIPYLLNVQSDLLDSLATRVVVPLARPSVLGNKSAHYLNPLFEVEGTSLVMLTPEMAGVPKKNLGAVVGNLTDRRADVVRALDIVFSGV